MHTKYSKIVFHVGRKHTSLKTACKTCLFCTLTLVHWYYILCIHLKFHSKHSNSFKHVPCKLLENTAGGTGYFSDPLTANDIESATGKIRVTNWQQFGFLCSIQIHVEKSQTEVFYSLVNRCSSKIQLNKPNSHQTLEFTYC